MSDALFSPEEVVSAGENKNIVVPFYSKIIARVDRLKEWFEFTPKFAYAMAASLVVIIIPLLFLLREPVPLSLQISMVAYQDTLSRSNQKAAVPITVNKGVTLSADDCIQLHFKASKDVYGYLIHQNSTWIFKKYFEGKLVAGQSYQFPEEGTNACLTGKPGKEIFYLITSETPLVNFDDKILPITNPTEPIPHSDVLQVIKSLFPQAIIETFDYSFN